MRKGRNNIRKTIGEDEWIEYQRLRKQLKVVSWRRRTKNKLVQYKGGRCEVCGYNKDVPSVYEFHHNDRNAKEFGFSAKTISIDRLKKEVDKCRMVCVNCHREIHQKINDKNHRGIIERKEKEIEQLIKVG